LKHGSLPLLFYLFAAMAVARRVLVIASRNPVHSVLFLILAFFNAAGCSCCWAPSSSR
jgi:NADH:ubiquinone oxidoreductase subunit 6 (subunit J)